MTGTLTLEAEAGGGELDLGGEDRWQVLVLQRGSPAARIDLAAPGAKRGGALLAAAVLRWADPEAAREELSRRLGERLGVGGEAPSPPPLSCSVIVCTRRRRRDLARLLGSLADLDPAPLETIVVDNDPGEESCRAEAEAAGCRYLREDRRGLDNARNAGIAAARGEVVAFVDDDCVASPSWLARLPREFADPTVALVTGPAFPHLLDTPPRRRMEQQASLARGLERLEFDWTVFPVAGAGAIGVGANMAFRRSALTALGPRPFPPELDAGTPTESGGDTYVIARLLAAGHRAVYDPATFVYHRHRADAEALHRAFRGYGIGLAAALTRLTLADGELSAPATWLWLLTQYRRTQQRRLAGRADAVETRLAWDMLRGGLIGPLRWARARRLEPGTGAGGSALAPIPAPRAASAGEAPNETVPPGSEPAATDRAPLISVIVPTHERPEALARCLAALAAQDLGTERFEVVVADDSPQPTAVAADQRLRLRVVRGRGRGAAAARNAGAEAATAPLLLFLDDDVVAAPDLVRRHLERQRDRDDLVLVGAYPPRPRQASLAALAAWLWWHDLFRAMAVARAPTYSGVLSANFSLRRETLARVGGFDERFGRYRREDWEWGLRALEAGVSWGFEPAARGAHEYGLDAPGRTRAARLEGYGDAVLLREHPDAGSAVLPLFADPPSRRSRRALWRLPAVRALAAAALAGLERTKLRLSWVRLFGLVLRLEYGRGMEEAGGAPPASEPLVDLDLAGSDPIAPPTVVAPTLRVLLDGAEVARVRPALGQWTPGLPAQILRETPWWAVDAAAARSGCTPDRKSVV